MFRFLSENARFLTVGFVLMLTSSYGQTFFISIFAGEIMESFSLTDGEWGAVYTAGTMISALVMLWAGAQTDRFRVRALAWIVLPGLGVSGLLMAVNPWPLALIGIVFLLRIFGQGMTFQLAAVAMARWFSARRGLALSISTMGFYAGQAAFPALFAALLLVYDWRLLWAGSAVLVFVSVPVVVWLLAQERTPQSLAKEDSTPGMRNRHWTRREMLRTPFFWLLVPLLLGPPCWGTALFFQQVHIATVKGWALVDYLSLIPILTAVSVAATLLSGQLIDRFGSGRVIQIYLLPWVVGFLLLANAETIFAAAIAFAVFGLATGTQATVVTAFWAEYFGTRHLGAIKAASTSIMVFGSAIGPGVTGILIDLGYDFPSQMPLLAIYFAVANLLAVIAIQRTHQILPSTR